ncbi:MAG: HAD family hydrolase [Erysipelotrichaceae bacterium]|nr:HAD family hydrolase [Erysipelotrichaceae bacterium]
MKKEFEKIKVIVCDIDGTIVDETREIHQVTVDKINELRDMGYVFALASGRPVRDLLDKYEEWKVDRQFDFIIGLNGVELYDNKTGKTESYKMLRKEWIKDIIGEMISFDPVIGMYVGNEYWCSLRTERSAFSAYKSRRTFAAKELPDFYVEDRGGIMFRMKLEIMPEVEKVLDRINSEERGYKGFKTQTDLVEFANAEANKGYALKMFCDKYGYELDECLAFGDTTNDNEMLKCCHGVCLKNGSDDTKACAEYITDKTDKEDGFVDFIDKYVLNND